MVNVIVVVVLLIRPEGIVFKEQSPTICTTSNAKCYALDCIGNSLVVCHQIKKVCRQRKGTNVYLRTED